MPLTTHSSMLAQIRSELETAMHNQIDMMGGLNRLQPGIYEIVAAYPKPLDRSDPPIEMGDAGKPGRGLKLLDSSSFAMGVILERQDGLLAALALPADEYVADALPEIIGKKVLSDGESFCVLGDSCAARPDLRGDDRNNRISPFFVSAALKRARFFEELGMLRSERLIAGVEYRILSVDMSKAVNIANNVSRLFVELKVKEVQKPIGEAGGPLTPAQCGEDQITMRIYFTRLEEPNLERVYGFLSLRVGRVFSPSLDMSTITRPRIPNLFLRQFVPKTESPLMQAGKVYVVDGVAERGESSAYIVFHDTEIDKKVEECDRSVLTVPGVTIATINCFHASYKDDRGRTPVYVNGRRTNDVIKLFEGDKISQIGGKRVFSVSYDVYDGMLDYLNFGGPPNGLELFSFGNIDSNDEDKVAAMRANSFARSGARSRALARFDDTAIE